MKKIQTILNIVLSKNIFNYILIDKDFYIKGFSQEVGDILHFMPMQGDSVFNLLPELAGYEDEILDIFAKKIKTLKLDTIQKKSNYYNIHVDYYDDELILVLLQDITEVAHSRQEALQQSNQTLLMYDILQKIIDGQNTLIFVVSQQEKIEFMNQKFIKYFNIDETSDQKNNLNLYERTEETFASYQELYNYIQNNEIHITIYDDIFVINASKIDSYRMLFSLSMINAPYID